MKISKGVVLPLLAIIGTLISFNIVNIFIISTTVGQYLAIEVVISILHFMYNKAKTQVFKS